MTYLIHFLLIGLVAGWLAGTVVRSPGYGILGNLVVGVIGAVPGGFVFRLVGFAAIGLLGNLIAATVGAVVLLIILQTIRT